MANSIALNSDMDKLVFTNSLGTTEISLSGNGAIFKISGGEISAEAASASFTDNPVTESTGNAQWTLTYNEGTNTSWIIGIDDIDTTKTLKGHEFDMDGSEYNIKRIGSDLKIFSQKAS